jgi:hypothetical protein
MSTLNYKVVCGITGEEITEYRDMLFISTYINGEKTTLPLHLNKWEILRLHNASPTSKKSREAAEASNEATSVQEDSAVDNTVDEVVAEVEVMTAEAPY